jgi:predicted polyphosphate/ATP-dependent NAD kinase
MLNWFERIGLIVNPGAGGDPAASLEAAARAVTDLGVVAVVTGPESLGASALSRLNVDVETCDVDPALGAAGTRALATQIADRRLDIVIVVGGDGTMADVAGAVFGEAHQPRILGIGTGSTNAGALVTCRAADARRLDPGRLYSRELDALVASVAGQPPAIAFNDCVVGNSVIGTLDGRLVNLDAAGLLQGRREIGEPRSIGRRESRVTIVRSSASAEVIAAGLEVGTVVVGFAEQAFRGKAVAGGICLATLARLAAGCLVADQPLARVGQTAEALLAARPIRSAFIGIAADDAVVVSGAGPGAVLCADGNPIALLGGDRQARIGLSPRAVRHLVLREVQG